MQYVLYTSLQQAMCVAKDVQPLVNKGCYEYYLIQERKLM